jgi:serine/threonine-protein kinase RsbW
VEQVVADLAAVAGAAEVSEVVARAGTAVFGARRSAVWLADAATGSLQLVAGDADLPAPGWPAEVTDEDGLVLTPIEAGERALGVLVLERSSEDLLDRDELSLLQTLGRQAGQAMERALLYDEQRSVATTLQHSLLPRTLPADPRLGLSACYRPAGEGLEVGGDWYDAFLLDPDRVAVVVGDVVGRGLAAAAAMGQLRSAVRALAAVDSGPALLLARLDRFVDGVPAAETATLAYAELDLRDGRVRYACAGHPPPVLVAPAGQAVLLWEGRSAPLGAHFGSNRSEAEVTLVPGARLALYTDGLVERRDEPLDTSIERLAGLLGGSAAQPLDGLADRVTETALGARRTGDDVCLLLVAFEG